MYKRQAHPLPRMPDASGTVALDDPAVRARCLGVLPLGERITATLTVADPKTRNVQFEKD